MNSSSSSTARKLSPTGTGKAIKMRLNSGIKSRLHNDLVELVEDASPRIQGSGTCHDRKRR